MLGETLHRIFPPESRQLDREMADAIAHGRGGGEEGWRLRKDGRFWATGELTPIRERDTIVVYHDRLVAACDEDEQARERREA